jgi:hypothetical protein
MYKFPSYQQKKEHKQTFDGAADEKTSSVVERLDTLLVVDETDEGGCRKNRCIIIIINH